MWFVQFDVLDDHGKVSEDRACRNGRYVEDDSV